MKREHLSWILVGAVLLWIAYGSFKGGEAYNAAYAAKS